MWLLSTAYFEVLVLVAVIAAAWFTPQRVRRQIVLWERPLRRFARHTGLAVVFCGLLPVVLRLLLLPVLPVPVPGIHDEYSHILVADTLLQGRLANPPHPLWQHFETFFVLPLPKYASQYPPGTGAMMALGKLAFGSYWSGVVISVMLMAGCVCWALQAWLPPYWALWGGILVGLRLGVFSYWMNSYWGGALTAAAGALLVGSWGRLRLRPSAGQGALLGLSTVSLAALRPFEGVLLCCVPVYVLLLVQAWQARRWRPVWPAAGSSALVLFIGAYLLLVYYQAVTQRWLVLPHQLTLERYGMNRVLPWTHAHSQPVLLHKPMQDYVSQFESSNVSHFRSLRSTVAFSASKVLVFLRGYAGPLLLPAVLLLPWALVGKLRAVRLLAVTIPAGIALLAYFPPHYAAPATALIMAGFLQGLRCLPAMGPRLLWRTPFGRMLPFACLLSFLFTSVTLTSHPVKGHPLNTFGNAVQAGNTGRAKIEECLQNLPGRHLVVVRYAPAHNAFEEWVHNGADLFSSKILWAREMDPDRNRALQAYFHDRSLWLLEPDTVPVRLVPYPKVEEQPVGAMPQRSPAGGTW